MEAPAHSLLPPGIDLDVVRNVHGTPFPGDRPSISTARSSESTNRSRISGSGSGSGSHRGSHESKPRLSKDQHERLEAEFHRNHKPTTASKRQFSQQLGISLEKVNNWFQNRRAKVKHEEKKQRDSISSWSETLAAGIPLSDRPYIDSLFRQTQNPSCVSEPADFHGIQQQPSFSPDGTIAYGNCPPIQEEPGEPNDGAAFMHFMGLDNHHGGNVQLQDIDQVSKQFNPNTGLSDALSTTPNAPSSRQDSARQSVAAPYSQNTSSTNLIKMASHDSILAPPVDGQRTPSSFIPGHSMGPNGSLFSPGWTFSQPTPHETPFNLQQAKDMVHQLQVQTSQGSPHEQHVFRYPTSQTQVANPQPVAPLHSFGSNQTTEFQAHSSHIKREQHNVAEEFKTPARCDSGTSLLADNVNGVDLTNTRTFPPPQTSSTSSLSLAQRRRKQPANISATASRSYSSSHTPLSASDRNNSTTDPAEARLRRIKSSGTLVNSGRVQKSGQRSPLQWSFGEGSQHLSRQLSTSSLNAAILKPEENGMFGHGPILPPYQMHSHTHHPSNSSGLTHMTIPEDNSQNVESLCSRLPSTSDTPHTSVSQSLPQTAKTSKSYASPPHSPMDASQMAAMHLHHTGGPNSQLPGFPGFQPQPAPYQFPAHGLISPHNTPNQPQDQAAQPSFSTEDLLLNSIPIPQHLDSHPQFVVSDNIPSHFTSGPPPMPTMSNDPGFAMHPQQPQSQPQPQPQQPLPQWVMNGMHPIANNQAIQHVEPSQPHAQHHFIWSTPCENGVQHNEQSPGEDLQIHQFTPQNPVEPSALPPKQKGTSPRQNYSFQNFGPDFYSSPKSQSSQSKTSSPGPLHFGG